MGKFGINWVIFGILAANAVGQCQFDTKCFRYSFGCTLANAFPYDRSSSISCTDCLNKCLKQQKGPGQFCCRAAVYDGRYGTCDLFAVNAMMPPYKLTKMNGRCYFQPTGYCSVSENTPAPPTQAPATTCPSGQTAKVVAIKDYQYPGLTGTTVPNVDATGCGQLCVQNKLPDGKSIDCKAAQYTGNQCIISSSQNSNVEATVQPSPGSTFYQKLCFPTGSVINCPDIFEEDPQKILVGQNRQTVDATSIQDCMQQCLDSQKNYGFVCKSGMYFYQETQLSCILNTESKSTKPDLWTDATTDKVTYFEPGCNGGMKLAMVAKSMKSADIVKDQPVINGEWTIWSPCGVDDKQYRFKQCEKSDPRKCEKQEHSCSDPGEKLTDDEGGPWFKEEPQLKISSIPDGNATKTFTPCKATFRNGIKNCTLGLQTVDGDLVYCDEPVDC